VDARGQTALHHAAAIGNVELVKALVIAGAKVNATDSKGDTPLHMATLYTQLQCICELLSRYASCCVYTVEKQRCPGGDTLCGSSTSHTIPASALPVLSRSTPRAVLLDTMQHPQKIPEVFFAEGLQDSNPTQPT
jgi:Ankyrin repeats (3 copies)